MAFSVKAPKTKEKVLGESKYRTAVELARREYIHKYFIPNVQDVPFVRKKGDKYQLIKRVKA